MRPNATSVGSPGLPAKFSVTGTLVLSLAMSLAVVVTAVALLYPVVTAAFLTGGATAYVVPVTARRIRTSSRTNCQGDGVRVPFTDRCIDV